MTKYLPNCKKNFGTSRRLQRHGENGRRKLDFVISLH